jgi:type III pantothenate kinase
MLDWLRTRGAAATTLLENAAQLPLRVRMERPEAVGIDRLLDAVAANQRRPTGQPALVADCGSAITIDLLSANGDFLGGAIAPGLGMSARGLHQFTHALPLVSVTAVPPALGTSTTDALRSGLFWGSIGAVQELVHRLAKTLDRKPIVYLTGGDAELLAPHLSIEFSMEWLPELTLHGIYLATRHAGTAFHGSGAGIAPAGNHEA